MHPQPTLSFKISGAMVKDLRGVLPWHTERVWVARDIFAVDALVIHQTMAEKMSVWDINTYHTSPNHISIKGCPRICYHFVIEKDGTVCWTNSLIYRVWHAGKANTTTVGILVNGDFHGEGHVGKEEPTDPQLSALGDLVRWLRRFLHLEGDWLKGHDNFGKAACPGFVLRRWIDETLLSGGIIQ